MGLVWGVRDAETEVCSLLQSVNVSLHFSLLGLQNWVFQLEAQCLPSELRIEAGGLHPTHPSLIPPGGETTQSDEPQIPPVLCAVPLAA